MIYNLERKKEKKLFLNYSILVINSALFDDECKIDSRPIECQDKFIKRASSSPTSI